MIKAIFASHESDYAGLEVDEPQKIMSGMLTHYPDIYVKRIINEDVPDKKNGIEIVAHFKPNVDVYSLSDVKEYEPTTIPELVYYLRNVLKISDTEIVDALCTGAGIDKLLDE